MSVSQLPMLSLTQRCTLLRLYWLVTTSYFLVLRVFDEHKDYELDCMNHPQRVLQRGLVTLKHLKVMAIVSIVIQVIFSLILDIDSHSVLLAWAIAFVWTCLMGKEFFCGEWLERKLTLYALSHMLVTPMIMWWLTQMSQPGVEINRILIVLMVLSFVGGLTAEIVRKTRGPEEERETVDSYSKIFGTTGSAFVVMFLITVTCAIQAFICYEVMESSFTGGYIAITLGYVAGIWSLLKFVKSPSLRGREKNESFVALAILVGYFTIIGAVVSERGVVWVFA